MSKKKIESILQERLLLKEKLCQAIAGNWDLQEIELLIREVRDLNYLGPQGKPPLLLAVEKKNIRVIEMLQFYGADPDLFDKDSTITPRQLARNNNEIDIFTSTARLTYFMKQDYYRIYGGEEVFRKKLAWRESIKTSPESSEQDSAIELAGEKVTPTEID